MVRSVAAFSLLAVTALALLPGSHGAICSSASGCEFWDDDYHEYILYEVDTAAIDVLIVPPASPFATRDIATLEKSVQAWDEGIDALGSSWLAAGVTINDYTLGVDVPPLAAIQDAEIIVIAAEYNPFLLFGIGLQNPFGVCMQQGGVARSLPTHTHEGSPWTVLAAECEEGGMQCLVVDTNFLLGGQRRMYDLNAHEVGHCLGIGHVGDALDFDARTVPLDDIMSYQYDPSHVHCVSSLNLLALEGVYADLLGQTGQLFPGDFAEQAPADYSQVACPNP